MSRFQFEGDFKRKPEQKLGGRSQVESRDAIILKAQSERNKRERDRLRATAILSIQAAARSYICRQRCKNEWRSEFDKSINSELNLEGLGEEMKRINLFYNVKLDNDRLHDLGKKVLAQSRSILEVINKQVTWHVRMKHFIILCLEGVENSRTIARIFIRLIEIFTNIENPSLAISTEGGRNNFVPELWAELVGLRYFYERWKLVLEKQLELSRDYIANPLPLADSLVVILQKPLSLAKFLVSTDRFGIPVNGRVLDTVDVGNLLMTKFVIAFSSLTFANNDPRSRLFFDFVIPKLRPNFPCQLLMDNLVMLESFENQRQIFSTTLSLVSDYVPSLSVDSLQLERFMSCVQLYIKYIDIRYAPVSRLLSTNTDYLDEDLDDEDMQVDEEKQNLQAESVQIVEKLKTMFNECRDLENFFDQSDKTKWGKHCPIISRIFNHYGMSAFGILRFLGNLSCRKTFIRSIFRRILEQGIIDVDENISFCWIFLNSIVALHDSEFIAESPLNVVELNELIILLKSYFTETILNDRAGDEQTFLNKAVVRVLVTLHERNTRLQFVPEDSFCAPELGAILPLDSHMIRFDDFDTTVVSERLGIFELKLKRILLDFPFVLSFHNRVTVIHRLISIDRAHRFMPYDMNAHHVQIRRNYIYEDAFEKLSLENVSDMRGNVRISLVNVVGAMEAGIDGGGLLREFLTEATKAGVDPNRGLFRLDSQNRLYPNPIAKYVVPDYRKHFFLIGRLVGKALYEQTLLELPLAAFFLESCIMGHVPGAVDYLGTLDPALHKNLLALKNYSDEDFNSLGLDFTLTVDRLGDASTVELKPNGSSILVSQSNVIEYIHLVADHKINRETREMCAYFREGLVSVCPIPKLFTWRELQALISGSDKPIDLEDWKSHTNYTGGYTAGHPMIEHFWEVVQGFEEKNLRKLLKFVTSCSRPPLLGFKDLVPNFGIQSAGQTDRLPSAATCMNLLKLPDYTNPLVLREKLIYAIEAQAGFELS